MNMIVMATRAMLRVREGVTVPTMTRVDAVYSDRGEGYGLNVYNLWWWINLFAVAHNQ